MNWHEDFFDEPAIEERSAWATVSWSEELHNCTCEQCCERFDHADLSETGMHEYYCLNIDPGTRLCVECLEAERSGAVPDDPELFDCYTPLEGIL